MSRGGSESVADFSPQYDPKTVEDRIYKLWEEGGFFAPEAHKSSADNSNSKKSFTIVVPPPNITGSLHMGHALNATIQDILVRKKRMEGYKTLWLPGTDHAGIATQNVVEKDLKKQGISRHDLGREKFLEKIWEWKEKYGNIILDQFKKLGASMDWSRTRFTMDEKYQKAVAEAFLYYHKKGWLYKAERVINWCVRCQTSLSDLELEYKQEDGKLYFIRYPLVSQNNAENFLRNSALSPRGSALVVATTRPETMLGDSAVAVNPKDERYKNLVGKKAMLPIQNREIPIIADDHIEQEFGTGAVKVTPAHDFADADMGERHKLPFRKIIDERGKMTKEAGAICEGLKIGECRDRVVAELKKEGLIEKEEPYRHNVAICYRCGTVIEPLPSMQWFLKMQELAKMALNAAESGKVRFHPERWKDVYIDWLKNVRDWNVSRQIWWGHKIPLEGETDVLDTWFSSALWPVATLGWPEKTKDLKTFYPTSVLSTARDIINLWVMRMVFSGLELMNEVPFSDVIVHATILTKDGKRMSKSLGTGIDPMTLIEKYGADATRFGLIWQAMGGQDVHWSEEHVVAGKKFCNKIWNAARFVLSQLPATSYSTGPSPRALGQLPASPIANTDEDKKILERLEHVKKEVSGLIDTYEFGQALHDLYDFFWHEFCDIYLETAKKQLQDEKLKENTEEILSYVLYTSLKLLHPFMPFITEEIWSKLPIENKKHLIIESWLGQKV
ncbi:MAG: valine--tRNA ligase [bacterium]|nr:valine--tRNA ligase [bacterium]